MIPVHNKQFLLTKTEIDQPIFNDWVRIEVDDYELLTHPNLSVTQAKDADTLLIGLGEFYDYRNPENDNDAILSSMARQSDRALILNEYFHLSGENVLIMIIGGEMVIVNDACSQMEVYYDLEFSKIGSQPRLFERFVELSEQTDPDAKAHFESERFKRKKTNIGIDTQHDGIRHLIGNHLLDLKEKKQVRFYPNKGIGSCSVQTSAEKVKEILTGYLHSLANRGTTALPVTAGIDSRVILTCALDAKVPNLEFYTIKFPWMDDDHNDMVIPKRIAKKLGIKLDIYDISEEPLLEVKEFNESLTLHNTQFDLSTVKVLKKFGDRGVTMVDGSIIGTSKNFFGKLINIKGKDLARMSGYANSKFAQKQFDRWLSDSKETFKKFGYHILDMFFWEDRASNWMLTVKSKFLLVCNYYSIFNSRALFEATLMTKRRFRDAQDHKIFNHILSHAENDLKDIPINPSIKKKVMLLGKKLGIYYIYRNLAIKLGILKFR